MTKGSRIDVRAIGVALMLSIASQGSTAMNKMANPPTPIPFTLAELVNALPSPMPTTVGKVEAMLKTKLRVKDENPFDIFYDGGPFITRDRHRIASIDARMAKPGSDHWHAGEAQLFLLAFVMDSFACTPAQPMHDALHLGKSTSVNVPAPWGETDYSRNTSWGSIGMTVSNATPNCVKSFGVSTIKEEPSLPQ